MADDWYDVIIKDLMVEDLMVPARDGSIPRSSLIRRTCITAIPNAQRAVSTRECSLQLSPALFCLRQKRVERNAGILRSRFFAQRGYVSVYQDCRGTFQSEGDVNFLIPEAEDGYDTLQWIDRAAPWSNGRVGFVGNLVVGLDANGHGRHWGRQT